MSSVSPGIAQDCYPGAGAKESGADAKKKKKKPKPLDCVAGVTNHLRFNVETEIVCIIVATDV